MIWDRRKGFTYKVGAFMNKRVTMTYDMEEAPATTKTEMKKYTTPKKRNTPNRICNMNVIRKMNYIDDRW